MASETPTRTPNSFVVFLGIAAAFVVVAAVFAASMAASKPVNEVELKRAAQRLETRAKLDAEALDKLNSLGWADKAKGTVHVPIATAMSMVVAELTAKKPAPSSVKVEAPLPMPVADPKSTEPPQAAFPSAPQGADTIRFALPVAVETPATPAPAAPVPAPAAPAPEKPAEAVPAPAVPPPAPAPAPEPPSNPPENPAPTK